MSGQFHLPEKLPSILTGYRAVSSLIVIIIIIIKVREVKVKAE
jgi:hypothetical protein